jgi:hypothetical protein
MLGHKASPRKYKKIEIITFILSENNALNYKSATKTAAKNIQTIGS